MRNILCKVTGKNNEANKSLRITEDWILLLFNSINIMTIVHYKDELKVKNTEKYFIIIVIQNKGVIID